MVNLSLFADPYLYYCKSGAEQRAILRELEAAARYAQKKGVLIVSSAGNQLSDLQHPGAEKAAVQRSAQQLSCPPTWNRSIPVTNASAATVTTVAPRSRPRHAGRGGRCWEIAQRQLQRHGLCDASREKTRLHRPQSMPQCQRFTGKRLPLYGVAPR